MAHYRYTNVLFERLSRVICERCGMVFASPMPSESALKAYNAGYFEHAHGGEPTNAVAIAFHSGVNRLRVGYVDRYLEANGISVNSVLEIGPGGGHFARHWLVNHPGNAYHAIEADRSLQHSLRGLGIRLHEHGEELPADLSLDVVVMSHVLEHTADPVAFLRMATSRLRVGGALFLEVPCRDWEHKVQDEPHLLFFDKVPMARLLEGVGFSKIQLSYHGKEIGDLRSQSSIARIAAAMRNRLISLGVVGPFGRVSPGLEQIAEPLERAAVAPFEAHLEKSRPAWWLRALAVKSSQAPASLEADLDDG